MRYYLIQSLGYIFTYFGPLCFVLLVTISKEAVDDYQRYKRDKEANSQLYQILTSNGPRSIPSSKIRVGDMIVIRKDQRVGLSDIYCRGWIFTHLFFFLQRYQQI